MSAPAVLNAERIKLFTTRSVWWSAAGAAVLSLGLAAAPGLAASPFGRVTPEDAVLGLAVFGVPVLMIVASMTVTGEYRTGTIRTTFLATPDRTLVVATKAVVAALFAGVYAGLMVLAAIVVARLTAGPVVGERLSLAEPDSWRVVGTMAGYAGLAAVLAVGIGAVVRFAPGAVSVLLLWPLVAEPLLGNMPGWGTEIGPWLPFVNIFRFAEVEWLFPTYTMPWGEVGSLLYFVAVVAVVFVAAVVTVNRRDA